MNIFTIIACARGTGKSVESGGLLSKKGIEEALNQQKNARFQRNVPMQSECKCYVRNKDCKQCGIVSHKLEPKMNLQEDMHDVATGPGNEHADKDSHECVRVARIHTRCYCPHAILGTCDYAAHERASEEAPAHQETVVHVDAGREVVHADTVASEPLDRLSKFSPPQHDKACKDEGRNAAHNVRDTPEVSWTADHARINADAQVVFENSVTHMRCVEVENVTVVVHESEERNNKNGSACIDPGHNNLCTSLALSKTLISSNCNRSQDGAPKKNKYWPGAGIHCVPRSLSLFNFERAQTQDALYNRKRHVLSTKTATKQVKDASSDNGPQPHKPYVDKNVQCKHFAQFDTVPRRDVSKNVSGKETRHHKHC